MEKSSLVLDISSDEETDDHDWLSELLLVEEEGKCDSDSNEAVVVTDLLPNFDKKSILKDNKSINDDDDDDDCVVLECDPDKLVAAESGKGYETDNSDDLEIVGEKGEIACRDFPHSRHLCVTYQFSSTPHETHCSQCHCYVCDTIAPCSDWGTGTSSIDHCHATDKDTFWRDERKSKKEGNRPVANHILAPISSCIVSLELPALYQPHPNSLLPNHIVRPVVFRPCSVSSNAGTPDAFEQPRCNLLGSGIYKPQPQLVSRRLVSPQLHTTYNNYNAVNRSSRFFPSFKRPGFVGTAPQNRFRYFRSYNGSQLSSERGFQAIPPARLNECDFPNLQRVSEYAVDCMSAQHDPSIPLNYDVPEIHSPSISSCLIQDPATTNVRFPFLNSNGFVNVAPFQPQVACQPFMTSFNNMILSSQTHASNQSDPDNDFGYMGNGVFENQSSQTCSYGNIYPATINGQKDFQQEDQNQSGLDMNAADFGYNWDASHCHGNSQGPDMASQFQNIVPVHHSHNPSILVEENHEHEVAPVANLSLLDSTDCHFSEITSTKPFDVQLDNWMFENPSSPGAYEIPLSPIWNVSSPEPGLTDAGTLFGI